MTIKVTKYGQDFTFDDNTPQAVQDRRIESWMKQNRPDAIPAAPSPAPSSGGSSSKLANVATALAAASPLAPLLPMAALPGVRDRLGDVNLYRTIGQGVIPLADEGVAGIRSLLPQSWGGTDYNTALAAERQGVKDYAEKHGEGESLGLQLAGGLATIPLTMGAGAALQGTRGALLAGQAMSKLPLAGKAAQLAAKYPTIAQALTNTGLGGAIGAGTGFAAGEGDFNARAANAGYQGIFGAGLGAGATGVGKIAEHTIGKIAGGDNAVANYLRKRLVGERGEQYRSNPNIDRLRDANGEINTNHPDFANLAADDLKQALAEQRSRAAVPGSMGPHQKGSDVMMADVLPGTTEAVSLKPGDDTTQLGRDIIRRQYDKNLPQDIARGESQHGMVDNWFKRLYGDANFRGTEEELLATRKALSDRDFAPAMRHNLRGADLEDALNDPYVGRAWQAAKEKMEAERKPIGVINPITNNISSYNTEFLHKIKTTMDDMITAARQRPEGTTGADTARIIGNSKNRLNDVIMSKNDEYRHAMEQHGDYSDLIEALRKGRQDVFGKNVNELDRGIGKQDIEAFLNDPTNSPAAKDLFRIGGARAAYEKLMGSDAANFGGNWAGVVTKPNLMEKFEALVPPSRAGDWGSMRDEMMQLSERHQNAARALAGSQTAKRGEMVKELQSPSYVADIVATLVNPSAPSASRNWAARFMDPEKHSKATANEVAKLLGMKGEAGNETAVERIRSILKNRQINQDTWNTGINTAARYLPYSGLPSKRRHAFTMPSDESN